MAQICSKCSRVNPDDAAYCYYDGRELGDHGRNGGPVHTSARVFANRFVFPSGHTCETFDQLAIACQKQWREATQLLQQGYLETFLSGVGRADLALAAREAARFPDQDRGLDQLLAKLPAETLAPPKLQVEPTEVNLGQLTVGQDRELELTLVNQGMRLLYGSVTCEDAVWLALGDLPGAPQKLFQFRDELTVPVRVRGDQLRAATKPLEARLSVESNGGNRTVIVRAEVPVQPFPDGVLAGARSPRQIAEKAKAAPKDAAGLFEGGAVAQWYRQHGWTYPVQGPPASGLGAVQQFFEALGLTPPPKVEISERAVILRGNPGDQIRHTIEVKTQEKRPVYAHATSNQAWLEVGRARLAGRIAAIHLTVPAVPPRDGEVLKALVTVTANGNQRFVVPVTLEVGFTFDFASLAPAPAEPEPEVVTAAPAEIPAPAVQAVEEPAVAEADTPADEPPAEAAMPVAAEPEAVESVPTPTPRRTPPRPRLPLVHTVPVALLGLFLLAVIGYDVIKPAGSDTPIVNVGDADDEGDPVPRIAVKFSPESSRFGISMLQEEDPKQPGQHKRLTSREDGQFNNTCIKVNDSERLFGQRGIGEWARDEKGAFRLREVGRVKNRHWLSIWTYPRDGIWVTQDVEIVRGEQTGLLDTCLVKYTLENKGKATPTVGLRVMLDTYIGANDGVPFLIPGERHLLTTMREFGSKDIPDSISALERPDPKDPGTVAHMGLKLRGLEPIEHMEICRWPGANARWDIKPEPITDAAGGQGDSCVVLYWPSQKMEQGEKRVMGFTYGLATVSSSGTNLGLMAHGSTRPGGTFTVTAYVKGAQAGQKVIIELPEGLTLAEGQAAEQAIAADQAGKDVQVSWRVQVGKQLGEQTITVISGPSREKFTVKIRPQSIFN
jgi:hypothetical protein